MCGFPFIITLILLALLVMTLCFFFGRRWICSPWHGTTRPEDHSPESLLEVLKKRYAKGDITKEELEQMRMDIQSQGWAP